MKEFSKLLSEQGYTLYRNYLNRIGRYFEYIFLLAFLSMLLIFGLRYLFTFSRIERYYAWSYLWAYSADMMNSVLRVDRNSVYTLLVVDGGDAALSEEERTAYSVNEKDVAVTENAYLRDSGIRSRARELKGAMRDGEVYRFLSREVYDGRPFPMLFIIEGLVGAQVFLIAGIGIVYLDHREEKRIERGEVIKGIKPVSVRQYNQLVESRKDEPKPARREIEIIDDWNYDKDPVERTMREEFDWRHEQGKPEKLRLPESGNNDHVEIMGDSGNGKSQLIMKLLESIRRNNERAVVVDFKGEMVRHFWEPGDIILNSQDARCPRWNMATDIEHEGDAACIADVVVQDERGTSKFFSDTPKLILEHLFWKYRPQPEDLIDWIRSGKIDDLIEGSGYEQFIAKEAGSQRAGVLASLVKEIMRVFRGLPMEGEEFSASEWVRGERGWIFLTCRQDMKALQIPIMSIWLQLLISKMLSHKTNERVWLILDELHQLRRLSALSDAVFLGRSEGLKCVLSFQGANQVKELYGEKIGADILSQPHMKFILGTSEPVSRKWAADLIGKSLVRRINISTTAAVEEERDSIQLQESKQWETIISESEIKALERLHGVYTDAANVVRFKLEYQPRPNRTQEFIPRPPSLADESDEPIRKDGLRLIQGGGVRSVQPEMIQEPKRGNKEVMSAAGGSEEAKTDASLSNDDDLYL